MKKNDLTVCRAVAACRAIWLLLLALGLGALAARAQTPPPYMTYQGYLTDGSGNPLGATNTGPKAYSVAFEIFTGPTSATGSNVWGELQTVTVDNGYYSVLLGQGGTYNGEPHVLSGTLFANPNPLYIQMTVQGIGTANTAVTILPRLQLVSSAFAFSAGSASELVNNVGTPIITSSGGSVTVAGTVTATSVTDSGALSAVGITDSGPLSATAITANSLNNAGTLSTGSLIATNTLSAGSITTAGALSAGSISTAGTLTARACNLGAATTSAHIIIQSNQIQEVSSGTTLTGNPSDLYLNGNGGGNTILNNLGGYVGIGTPSPGGMLEVFSSLQQQDLLRFTGQEFWMPGFTSTNGIALRLGENRNNNRQLWLADTAAAINSNNSCLMMLPGGTAGLAQIGSVSTDNSSWLNLEINGGGGYVGIGAVPATSATLTVGGGPNAAYKYASQSFGEITTSGFVHPSSGGFDDYNISIYANGSIWGSGFIANSDARIKHILGPSDNAGDLATLQRIEVTDYTYKDIIAQGNGPQKKVIAQQVEKVYPQAVQQGTGVVPDIYQSATVADGWVALATDLKVGERVRLIAEKTSDVHQVLEVRPGSFRTDFNPSSEFAKRVFVYGREVKDFRTVDYDAIAMLNVSATQELARQNEALSARVEKLEAREPQVAKLEQEVADLKRLVAKLAEDGKASKLASEAASPTQASWSSPKTYTTASLDRN